ncbi:MAG: KEOPS complex kinase/ATPase Bud32 [Candidatus Pacearchaeota archaeon]|nr:KEOPS complex kinase/ATPase Bud32 [Candidatus Pacearchaeota archaeon]
MKKIIARGAEAIISLSKNKIIKNRIPKSYRHQDLDKKLRTRRTKAEEKLLKKSSQLIPVPKLIPSQKPLQPTKSDFTITMQFIKGKNLSNNLENLPFKEICKQIGRNLSILHDAGIIHGDLTTSNMIYSKNKLYFIDFGLGFHSNKIEDKAVDLHLISQAIKAKHNTIYKEAFSQILKGYKKSAHFEQVLERLKKVEKRGRYKQQY